MQQNTQKVNILMFNMQTYSDFQNGIVNRNSFILKNLLENERVDKILAIDFLHKRVKRLIKDYYQGIISPHYADQTVYKTLYSRCSSTQKSEKLYIFSTINQYREPARLKQELETLIGALDMTENLIVWSYNPLYTEQFEIFPQAFHVFDTVDNWMTHSSHKNNIDVLQTNYKKIAQKADIIFTVSQKLLEFYKEYNRNENIHDIPNGVDFDMFRVGELNSTLKSYFDNISHPICGYLGSITEDRVDVDLVQFIASQHPDKSFVLAGPVWKGLADDIRKKLLPLKNIYFTGRIPYDQTANVMNEFDVCLNPHQENKFIRFTDPMKIYEYLALGKPIVSVANTGLEKFKDIMQLCSTKEEFSAKISTALSEDHHLLSRPRIEWAQKNSYQTRTQEMLNKIFTHNQFSFNSSINTNEKILDSAKN